MRILYFSFVDLDIPNACQVHTLGILSGFGENKSKVDAVVPRPKHIHQNIPRVNFLYIWPWRFSPMGKLWVKLLGGIFFLMLCLLNKYDAIYVRELERNPFPRLCARIFNIPYYLEINGLPLLNVKANHKKGKHLRRIERHQKIDFKCAAGLIVPSFPRSRWIIDKYGLKSKKVHIILNGATIANNKRVSRSESLKRLNLPVNGFFLGFLGTVWEHYDLKSVIEAMNLCKTKIIDLFLIIIGGGPGLPKIYKQADEKGILSRIINLGFIQSNDLFNVINAIDLGLMTLTREGLNDLGPITTRFATYASYGIPVIGNMLYLENYPKEIIKKLYTVPHENSCALSEKIIKIYNNPKERSKRAKSLQDYATNKLTWNAAAAEILEVVNMNKMLHQNCK
jgi:glycosyltransferase involved in cell wall biosynthesis